MTEQAETSVDDFPLQVIAIELRDRPGSVNSVAEVFSGRGLQIEALHGTAENFNPDGHAHALILFRAGADRASLVSRVLRRLSSVRSAELLSADDPRLIQSVLIGDTGSAAPSGISITAINPHTALAAGSPAAMQAWLANANAPQRLGALRLDLLMAPA
jgi:acetolactate synthase regulatory subunit